jgi:phospholipid/cholesterol/gamma-HCH transport system permease protein
VGAVVAIQMFNNFDASSFPIPPSFVGYATKAVLVLEFAPTIISLILAGKVGSYIASSIGTMRVSEQIDALDIMGVNSPNFLIFLKLLPVLFLILFIAISIVFGIGGGYIAGILTGNWTDKRLYCGYSNVYA